MQLRVLRNLSVPALRGWWSGGWTACNLHPLLSGTHRSPLSGDRKQRSSTVSRYFTSVWTRWNGVRLLLWVQSGLPDMSQELYFILESLWCMSQLEETFTVNHSAESSGLKTLKRRGTWVWNKFKNGIKTFSFSSFCSKCLEAGGCPTGLSALHKEAVRVWWADVLPAVSSLLKMSFLLLSRFLSAAQSLVPSPVCRNVMEEREEL